MDLQDIKKEIESLRKETVASPNGSSGEIFMFGMTKIKLGLILLASALSIYIVKPIYIYNLDVSDSGEIEKTINYKNLTIIFIITSILFISAIKYTKIF